LVKIKHQISIQGKYLINYVLAILINDPLPSLEQFQYSVLIELLGFSVKKLIQVLSKRLQGIEFISVKAG
jgi:hypothetical protein